MLNCSEVTQWFEKYLQILSHPQNLQSVVFTELIHKNETTTNNPDDRKVRITKVMIISRFECAAKSLAYPTHFSDINNEQSLGFFFF